MGCLGTLLLFMLLMALAELIGMVIPYIGIALVVFIIFMFIKTHDPVKAYWKFRLERFEKKYYISEEFLNIKRRIEKYVADCNELNEHIASLRNTHLGINKLNYGQANFCDVSKYNYERPEYNKHSYNENVYNCSRTVCDNARKQPFKYVCKYFNIKPTEENLENFEKLLNNYEAAKEGAILLAKEKNKILNGIESEIPTIIKKYGYKRFQKEIGFREVEFRELKFPYYRFQYVSPGGNASSRCDVIMDIKNLNRFISYMAENIKFQKSVAGQRALMTSSLRRKILERDHYICQRCKNSITNEPNLLLEVDHIIPLSKGGMTTEGNLQTLCWRCNRSKGVKIEM